LRLGAQTMSIHIQFIMHGACTQTAHTHIPPGPIRVGMYLLCRVHVRCGLVGVPQAGEGTQGEVQALTHTPQGRVPKVLKRLRKHTANRAPGAGQPHGSGANTQEPSGHTHGSTHSHVGAVRWRKAGRRTTLYLATAVVPGCDKTVDDGLCQGRQSRPDKLR
jgi:hypothetical protein